MSLSSTRDVARALGIAHYRLEYLIGIGAIPDAAQRVAGKRAWTGEEIEAIRNTLAKRTLDRKGAGK